MDFGGTISWRLHAVTQEWRTSGSRTSSTHCLKFECNYGAAALPLDCAAGSFREKLGKSECYTGGWNEETDEEACIFQYHIWLVKTSSSVSVEKKGG